MCAVLAEEPVAQDPGYVGEPETVNLYQCGGSLIAPGVVLTAAHCVNKFQQTPRKLKIRCGEWDTQGQTEPRPHQDRYVNSLDIHPEFQLDDSFICAGGVDGKDTCKGDGGSPPVCPSKYDSNTYVQAGIVAWGIGCGEDNTPGVYA